MTITVERDSKEANTGFRVIVDGKVGAYFSEKDDAYGYADYLRKCRDNGLKVVGGIELGSSSIPADTPSKP